jgi:hypothetical protein
MFARIRKEGVQSLTPFIYEMTPIHDIWPVLGMPAPALQQLAPV